MIIIGVDPGLSGAAGAVHLEDGRFGGVCDLPVMRDASLAWIDAVELRARIFRLIELGGNPEYRFVLERVSAMPKQGVSGVFTFGVTFGSILATLQGFGAPIEFVTPVKWKNMLGLRGKSGAVAANKRAALDKARLLFPQAELSLIKHEGRAEALLIAHWYQRNRHTQQAAA